MSQLGRNSKKLETRTTQSFREKIDNGFVTERKVNFIGLSQFFFISFILLDTILQARPN